MTKSTISKVLLFATLACLQTVQAEIIYSGAHQDIVIDQFNPVGRVSIAGSDSRWDDLVIDLRIQNKRHQKQVQAMAHPKGNGSHVQTAGVDGIVSRYTTNSIVNAFLSYYTRPIDFFSYDLSCSDKFKKENSRGNFLNETGYIGLQLSDNKNTYFGWAQVTTENSSNENARLIIHDWAYNNIPGEEIYTGQGLIVIPEPTSSSMVTVCAGSLLIFRRIFLI